MKSSAEQLLEKHRELIHSDEMKVVSHVQRGAGDWYLNTLMLEGYEVPFKYKRKKRYKSLLGAQVNLTYYPDVETVVGVDFEIMKVIRVRRT